MATLKFELRNLLNVDVDFWKQAERSRKLDVHRGKNRAETFTYHDSNQIRIHILPNDQLIDTPRKVMIDENKNCKVEVSKGSGSWIITISFLKAKPSAGEGDSTTNVTVTGDEN